MVIGTEQSTETDSRILRRLSPGNCCKHRGGLPKAKMTTVSLGYMSWCSQCHIHCCPKWHMTCLHKGFQKKSLEPNIYWKTRDLHASKELKMDNGSVRGTCLISQSMWQFLLSSRALCHFRDDWKRRRDSDPSVPHVEVFWLYSLQKMF